MPRKTSKRGKPTPHITREHAERLAEFLEDQGWCIFNGEEYRCPHCSEPVTSEVWEFCPFCGSSFVINPAEKDEEEYNSTLDILVEAIVIAIDGENNDGREED